MEYDQLLERIALAIERQVAQTDEQIARQDTWRVENLARADRQDSGRDAELIEARATNKELLERLDLMIVINKALEQALGSAFKVDAVDPVAANSVDPTTRD